MITAASSLADLIVDDPKGGERDCRGGGPVGCRRPARYSGLCGSHYMRSLRGSPIDTPIAAGLEEAEDTACAMAVMFAATDSEDDAAFDRAREQFLRIARWYSQIEKRQTKRRVKR
jgi:hypothetical protein